jgi:hypothetical protein
MAEPGCSTVDAIPSPDDGALLALSSGSRDRSESSGASVSSILGVGPNIEVVNQKASRGPGEQGVLECHTIKEIPCAAGVYRC